MHVCKSYVRFSAVFGCCVLLWILLDKGHLCHSRLVRGVDFGSLSSVDKKEVGINLRCDCAPYPSHVLSKYNDLQYQLRTPDLAIDALIMVFTSSRMVPSNRASLAKHRVSLPGHHFQGVVLCMRRKYPFKMCIPGGYVEYGESIEAAVVREVEEETGITVQNATRDLRQFRVYSAPQRDPRRHTVSVVVVVRAVNVVPKAADDVKECTVYLLDKIVLNMTREEFAFDHFQILLDFIASLSEIE